MDMEVIAKKLEGKGMSRAAQCIAVPVRNALISFCEQSEEFAQAIEQSDKSFDDCLRHVTSGVKQSISDLDAYRKAVQFYFSTADISFHMAINLSGNNGYEAPPITVSQNEKIDISLDSLLDF